MIVWIDRALALAMHDRQLAEHGGGSGVRDEGMLDSALARPQQRHAYGDPPPDLAEMDGEFWQAFEGLERDALVQRTLQTLAERGRPMTLAELAAALAFGLARNHPFVDGNKRTAAVACETFILLNDAALEASDDELYPRYLGLAEGSLDEAGFADWLRTKIVAKPAGKVQEPKPRYRK